MTLPVPYFGESVTRQLSASDPILAKVINQVGPCRLKPAAKGDVFHALLRSIIYQQLHGNAAAAIHARVLTAFGGERAKATALVKVADSTFRAAGLSANKLLAIRDLAGKTLSGEIPNAKIIAKLSDAELIERLTSVRGIGPWTVHMLMIFHLGRPDILPTGDYGVRKAFSHLYRRGRPTTPESLIRHAKNWQPYRSVASWYLWRSLDLLASSSDVSPDQAK